jgi:ribonuclease Z
MATDSQCVVSSLIVQIPGSGSVLLDCGEGTLGQLRRHFGDNASSVLRDIRCIFISHIHGDHHMGLSKLLSQRRKVGLKPVLPSFRCPVDRLWQLEPPCTSPVYLITNQSTFMYLREYNDLEDLGLDDPSTGVRVIYSEHAHWRRRPVPATNNSHSHDNEWKKAER